MYATLRCTAIVPGNLEQLGNTVLLLYRSTFVFFFFSSWRYSSMNLFLNAHFEVQIAWIRCDKCTINRHLAVHSLHSLQFRTAAFVEFYQFKFVYWNPQTPAHNHTHACTQPNIKLAFLGIQIGLDGTEKMTVQRVVFFGEWPLHLHLLIACCVMAWAKLL